MVETLYPTQMSRMSQFSDQDWIPQSATSLNSLGYSFDASFLSPPTSSLLPGDSPIIHARTPYTRHSNSYNTVENLDYSSNALRIVKQEGVEDLTYSSHPQITRSPTPYYGSFGVSEVNTSSSKRSGLVPIAPNPEGLVRMNRKHGRDDSSINLAQQKRRRVASNVNTSGAVELTEEERLLLRFKDEENLPWKDIALKFQTETGRTFQVPALQMRYKRLREKLRVWSDADIDALEKAREYWERCKWEIIATKMHTDFGVAEKWPAKSCYRKWTELHPGLDVPKEHGVPSGTTEKGWYESPGRESPEFVVSSA
ncbi:hypothetical protein FGG08_004444 [Glutinoglossum americanum]|uniref:Myb-like domain-containing protein n=1 Tax=Glutinoglossum americanum TaxID=1670608 RepID=A0A9P8KX33_9PEZI|nr:hypothetical protein FGG08_004444 [Glutinoglossum americanum]